MKKALLIDISLNTGSYTPPWLLQWVSSLKIGLTRAEFEISGMPNKYSLRDLPLVTDKPNSFDLCVSWGYGQNRQRWATNVLSHHKDCTPIFFDHGWFDRKKNFCIYLHGENSKSRGRVMDVKPPTTEKLWTEYYKPLVRTPSYWLFILQIPGDASLRHITERPHSHLSKTCVTDYSQFVVDTYNKLSDLTNRPIRIRKHPKHVERDYKMNLPEDMIFTRTELHDDLANCVGIITYNSSTCAKALTNNIPVFCLGGDFPEISASPIVFETLTKETVEQAERHVFYEERELLDEETNNVLNQLVGQQISLKELENYDYNKLLGL